MTTLSLHVEKLKKGQLNPMMRHAERRPGQNHKNKRIDDKKTAQNINLTPKSGTWQSRAEKRIKEGRTSGRAPRANSVYALSISVQIGQTNLTEEQRVKILKTASDWLNERYGRENTISSVIHLDETNPHLHFATVPITKDGRLSAKDVNNRESLLKNQRDFSAFMQTKFPRVKWGKGEERPFANGKSQREFETLEKAQREGTEAVNEALKMVANTTEELGNEWQQQQQALKRQKQAVALKETIAEEKLQRAKKMQQRAKMELEEVKEHEAAAKRLLEQLEKFKEVLAKRWENVLKLVRSGSLSPEPVEEVAKKYEPISAKDLEKFDDEIEKILTLGNSKKSHEMTL